MKHIIEMTDGGSVADLQIAGTYYRHKVGVVARGDEGRKVDQGPIVPGPWAYAFGLCTVLSASPIERDPIIDVEDGDYLSVDGDEYRVRVIRGQWIELDMTLERKTLKHEGKAKVGEKIRAYDFEPREGVGERYVEGWIKKITNSREQPLATGYLITVTLDTLCEPGERTEVFVPMETSFMDWDDRVAKVEA